MRSRFLTKQRAILKVYIISIIEESTGYGLEILNNVRKRFNDLGYRPVHFEIYKSLHELMDEGIIRRKEVLKEGADLQTIYYYYINNKEEANRYKKQVRQDIDRSLAILNRTLKDNYNLEID